MTLIIVDGVGKVVVDNLVTYLVTELSRDHNGKVDTDFLGSVIPARRQETYREFLCREVLEEVKAIIELARNDYEAECPEEVEDDDDNDQYERIKANRIEDYEYGS